MDSNTIDPVWERRYKANPGYRSWYPWSGVVSFVFRHAPPGADRSSVSVLELGCGTGNNVWFVAREGFRAAGIDASPTAIEFAQERLQAEGLVADLRVADLASLPFADGSFDLVFERAALSFTTLEGARACVAEAARVLKPGGYLFVTPYSDRDSSCYRQPDPDGMVRDIKVGTILGGSQTCFYGINDIRLLFATGWDVLEMKHVEEVDMARPERVFHCEWQVIVQKSI